MPSFLLRVGNIFKINKSNITKKAKVDDQLSKSTRNAINFILASVEVEYNRVQKRNFLLHSK